MTAELAEIENSVFRLSDAIKKTTRRANALKNIMIPGFNAEGEVLCGSWKRKE